MSQRIVAVDTSRRVARVVVLETSLRKTAVSAIHEVPLAAGMSREQAMAAVYATISGRIDTLVLATDVGSVSTRSVSFPFVDLRRVESAVPFELEGQVPFAVDDTALSWHISTRGKEATSVVAGLTPKEQLNALISDAERVGFEPRVVLPPASALADLAPRDSSEVMAVAALGASATHVAVVCRGELRWARSLRVGGDDVDRALAAAFKVDVDAARAAKEQGVKLIAVQDAAASDAESRHISEVAASGLAPLVSGLMTTFAALPASDAPTRLLITGGLSRLPGIVDFLRARLGIVVALADLSVATALADEGPAIVWLDQLLARVRRKPRVVEATQEVGIRGVALAVPAEYAVALAMAIAVARHGVAVPLNFRRGEFAYQGDIQLYRGQIKRIAVGIAVVVSLAIVGAFVRYTMLAAEERRINAGFCSATKKIVGREICDPTAALATMRQSPGAGDGVVIPSFSAAMLLEMMSKIVGKEVDVTFDDLELRVDGRATEPDRITGKGEAGSFETTEQLAESLKRDPCVQEVDVGKQRKTRDGSRVEFNLTVKVACPAGVIPGRRQDKQPAELANSLQQGRGSAESTTETDDE